MYLKSSLLLKRGMQLLKMIIVFQGGRFMSTAMYDAREALIPGSAYDRSSTGIYLDFLLFINLKCQYVPVYLFSTAVIFNIS